MKHKSSSEDNSQSQHTISGPGSQLRKARERQGLELAKVASQLHLNQSMVHALEWDDYDKLPAAVFVQGYLRKYARLLGVDEDTVIQTYQELQPDAEQQPLPRNQPDEVALELHSENRLLRYVSWGILLVLGVAVFFWLQGRMDSDEPQATTAEEREVIEPVFPSAEQDGLIPPRVQTLPPIRDTRRDQATTRGDTSSSTAPETASLPVPFPVTESSESIQGTVDAPPDDSTIEPSETIAAEPAPVTEALAEPAVPEAMPDGLVVFEFTGPCWVEVRDASGRARILGVMREGTRRSLNTGLGPFRIIIGDIFVARLSVNGETYDLRRHTRGKVARFTLDPSRL